MPINGVERRRACDRRRAHRRSRFSARPTRSTILKDPPAKVWNELKTVKPNETAFDQDTRVLEQALQDWDLGLDISRAAIEDLQEPVRQAMVHLVTKYYVELQKSYADILQHIYRPGGDDAPADPTPGGATASGSRARSRASRRTT